MEIKLALNKNVNENANIYFEKAKKLKNKIPGVKKTLQLTQEEINNFEKKKEEYQVKKKRKEELAIHKKEEWFDKFRYTKTSSGLLLIIGKDAGSNEVLLKKHSEENDLVFHTQAPGSPFGLLKNAKNKASKKDLEEAAIFVACFSSQWKRGFGTADAFWVEPNQVSKKAESGEYIAKGSFMVRGKKNEIKNVALRLGLGVEKKSITTEDGEVSYDELFSGSVDAAKKYCKTSIIFEPGDSKLKQLSKDIKKKLKVSHLEELPKFVPNGSRIVKR